MEKIKKTETSVLIPQSADSGNAQENENSKEKFKKENLSPREAGSVMDYRGQSFIKVGDKF